MSWRIIFGGKTRRIFWRSKCLKLVWRKKRRNRFEGLGRMVSSKTRRISIGRKTPAKCSGGKHTYLWVELKTISMFLRPVELSRFMFACVTDGSISRSPC